MKIKPIIVAFLSVLTIFSCKPLVDNEELGEVLSADQLNLVVNNTSPGSNEILMQNLTTRVGSYWDYGIGKSTKDRETVILPFLGETTISFTGICAGGTVTTTRKVTITKIDKPADPEWTLLAGINPEGKMWTWGGDGATDPVYGTGGYGNDYKPAWSVFLPGQQIGETGKIINLSEGLVFDLNSGANFKTKDKDGRILSKGTFKFDMSKKKIRDDGKIWSIGQLAFTGGTIPCGSLCWTTDPVYTYDIIHLSDDKMVLAAAIPDAEFQVWNEATFWCFRSK